MSRDQSPSPTRDYSYTRPRPSVDYHCNDKALVYILTSSIVIYSLNGHLIP